MTQSLRAQKEGATCRLWIANARCITAAGMAVAVARGDARSTVNAVSRTTDLPQTDVAGPTTGPATLRWPELTLGRPRHIRSTTHERMSCIAVAGLSCAGGTWMTSRGYSALAPACC
jgi:hypothetical protein